MSTFKLFLVFEVGLEPILITANVLGSFSFFVVNSVGSSHNTVQQNMIGRER